MLDPIFANCRWAASSKGRDIKMKEAQIEIIVGVWCPLLHISYHFRCASSGQHTLFFLFSLISSSDFTCYSTDTAPNNQEPPRNPEDIEYNENERRISDL